MKIFNTECVYFVQKPWRLVQHIFLLYVEDCVAAPRSISMFLKERVTASERYQSATAFERKCVGDIFCVCGCF